MEGKTHWEDVYRTTAADDLGWHQAHPTMSLNLIESTGVHKTANIIDVGGGDSTLVDHLLDQGIEHLTVLDISSTALERAKARLGAHALQVTWIEGDITDFRSSMTYDVWHDRAVFHFLTNEEDREQYRETMNTVVSPQGPWPWEMTSNLLSRLKSFTSLREATNNRLSIAALRDANCETLVGQNFLERSSTRCVDDIRIREGGYFTTDSRRSSKNVTASAFVHNPM